MTSIGLNSLNLKISKLESQISEKSENPKSNLFEDIIIHRLENKKKDSRKEEISKIKMHYTEGLVTQIDIEDPNNIIDIIYYSVLWVERNIHKLAVLLQSDVNSELKLMTCIELIHESMRAYDDLFLVASIESLVKIVFNTQQKKPVFPPPPPIEAPMKEDNHSDIVHIDIPSRSNSKKAKKYMLKNCTGSRKSN